MRLVMRIHELEVTNLASLKGKHRLDFDAILEENKLFAITGETGSGKSTLLNAISLALYGQNYKSNITQTDYVTLGESESSIAIIFSVGQLKYLAKWSCRLKKSTGEYLKTPKTLRELFQVTPEGLNPLPYTAEKILELSFEQFCKTIILNQGQFAQFLTSTFRERKEIIEKLYEGELLEKLAPALRIQINELKHELEIKESSISGLQGQLTVSVDELTRMLKQLQLDVNQHQGFRNLIKDVHKILDEFQRNLEQKIKNESRIEALTKDINVHTAELNQLKNVFDQQQQKLIHAKKEYKDQYPLLKKCQNVLNEKNSLEQLQKVNLQDIQNIEKNNKQQSQELEKLSLEIESDQQQLNSIQETIDYNLNEEQINLLDTTLISLKNIENQLNQINTHIKSQMVLKKDYEDQGKQSSINIDQLEKKLAQLNGVDSNGIELLEKELNLSQQRLLQLQHLTSKFIDLQTKNVKWDLEIKKYSDRLSSKKEEFSKQDQLLQYMQDSLKLKQLEDAISICRHESIKDGHCVVCDNQDISNLSEINPSQDQEHLDLKAKIEKQLKINTSLEKEIQLTKLQLENIRGQKDEQVKNIHQEFCSLIQKEVSHIDQSSLNQYTNKQQNDVNKRSQELQKLKEDLLQKQSLNSDKDKWITRRNDYRQKYINVQQSLNSFEQQLQTQSSEFDILTQKVFEIIPNTFTNKNLDLIQLDQLLKSNKKNLQSQKLLNQKNIRKNELNKILDNGKDRLNAKQSELAKQQHQLAELTAFIKDAIGVEDPDRLLEKLQSAVEVCGEQLDQIKDKQKKSELLLADFESRYQSSKDQIQQAESLCLQLWSDLKLPLKEICESEYQFPLENWAEILDFYQDLDTKHPVYDIEILEHLLDKNKSYDQEFQSILEEKKNQLTRSKTLLEQKQGIEEKVITFQNEIKFINKIKERKENLFQLVGKDEFRNFVLALIEKDLLFHTNQELQSLCNGRYQLLHYQKGKMAPDFYIIDRLKEGLTRKVSTLSGGETFMVSLAMALALAEMTRGQSEIDSFFIDEGFGTLDEDSLEDILDMLHHLHVRGKQIGIISHVKSLTSRIGTNVHLNKNSHGNSHINIVYN
jgi:exonuclease SbcC